MEIKAITDKKVWDEFVTGCPEYTFLQGWSWGAVSGNVIRLGAFKSGRLVGVAQVLRIAARRGRFLFVPHGPLGQFPLTELISLAKREKVTFLRISPLAPDINDYRALGFRDAPTIMHAEETWLIDVSLSEEEILKNMRKTTRNLIHRGERDGVVIEKTTDVSQIDTLYDLQIETSKRNSFVPFSKEFLKKEMEIFRENDEAVLFLGKAEGKTLAAAIIVFYGKSAFYYQSGSRESKVPVNYCLQWEVIKEAKRRGCTIYNMWGVAPPNKPRHRFAGITVFKTGFGGYERDYLHAQDYPLSWKYWLTYFIEKIPRVLRARV